MNIALSCHKNYFPILLILVVFIFSCSHNTDSNRNDIHSFARPEEVTTTHLDLDITVNFSEKQISGKVSLQIKNNSGANKLYLDSKELTILRATLGKEEIETTFALGDKVEFLGQPLVIDINPDTRIVNVYYQTTPEAFALQWLSPQQTAGGIKPFLFTQSQAILARTWIPCQDSPGIRITYTARVTVDPELMAVMSAGNPTAKNDSGIYYFEMPQPIPSYLLALAVGDIEFRSLGSRSGVYAEPAIIAKAAFEFADTEKMINAAEKLYGPYRWERYDIIVLPPSFPFGGMENPRLTFATPTILAGDRSLVALVAHELAHSWSGNLVTNATWNDFWLNEGFTVFFENRIMEAVYGPVYAGMLEHLGYQDLVMEMETLGKNSRDTHLFLDLKGHDPDDGVTNIAYEKGRFFLRMLEEKFGRKKWDAFLKSYFAKFAFKTMTTPDFITYLRQELVNGDQQLESNLMIDDWVYGPGIPPNCPIPQSNEFQKVEDQIIFFVDGLPPEQMQTNNWTTHHWLHYLRNFPTDITADQMSRLDNVFHFTKSGNSEILCIWLQLAIKANYHYADAALEKFLTTIGRRKFLDPLYRALAKSEKGLTKGRKIYEVARSGYHPVAVETIDKILKWKD